MIKAEDVDLPQLNLNIFKACLDQARQDQQEADLKAVVDTYEAHIKSTDSEGMKEAYRYERDELIGAIKLALYQE